MINNHRKETLVQLCQNLVRCPSVSGHERNLASLLQETMYSLGFDEVSLDYFGNVIGRIFFKKGGRKLLYEAQMDHVEVSDPSEWEFYPYGGFLSDGKIYGRGATDQKGSLTAMIYAASMLKNDMPESLQGELIVSATVHQEHFEGVSSQLVGTAYRPDYVVIGEASNLQVERGQRGRAEIILDSRGKMSHSAHPGYGINAAFNMTYLMSFIKEKFIPQIDPFLGKGILELTNIISFPRNNPGTIPDHCRAIFDRRLLMGETKSDVSGEMNRIIESAQTLIPDLDVSLTISRVEDHCYTGAPINGEHFVPAWSFPEDHPFITAALRGIQNAGLSPVLSTEAGFGTNGCYYGGIAKIPSIVFGPSKGNLAHITDEYIEVAELIKGCTGYYGIAREVLGKQK